MATDLLGFRPMAVPLRLSVAFSRSAWRRQECMTYEAAEHGAAVALTSAAGCSTVVGVTSDRTSAPSSTFNGFQLSIAKSLRAPRAYGICTKL